MGNKTVSPIAKVAKSNRGSKPGEHRGGRVKGQPNKATRTLKELAREYTDEALEALAGIMRASDSDAARVTAANALLDRGYGKPSTVLSGDEDGGAIRTVNEIIIRGNKPTALLPAP